MVAITTRKRDVLWNYVGTLLSSFSSFLLLPFLMLYLTGEELGLWYVFLAGANLTMLFEFGFTPTFARNIVYCLSGAKSLSKVGVSETDRDGFVDWHLFNAVVRASKLIYACVALAGLLFLGVGGSLYLELVIGDGSMTGASWAAWSIMTLSVAFNLLFYHYITCLRGYGDVAGENKAKVVSKLIQLAISIVLLFAGCGLIGAAIGYLAGGLALRFTCLYYLRRHKEIEGASAACSERVTRGDLAGVLKTISYVAWRDGVVQLALYASSQATTLLCSSFLTLTETGTYSIVLQFATALCTFAGAYLRSHIPMFQSACAASEYRVMREIYGVGNAVYLVIAIAGTAVLTGFLAPILAIIKPNVQVYPSVVFAICAYVILLNNHSIACWTIVSMNRIPYVRAYIFSAAAGLLIASLLAGRCGLGAWGLILGQAIAQLAYNNWHWPMYASKLMKATYRDVVSMGAGSLAAKVRGNLRNFAR